MIELCALTKRYGRRTVLSALDLCLPSRCLTVLLGPNGAGKSTLFQIASGLFAADRGDVLIDGISIRTHARQALARVGVVFQQMSLDLDLSVAHNLHFHADLHGLPRAVARERIAHEAAVFGIAGELARPARELSGGTRRKIELARALLHRPALLLLDEPTVGLDPASRRDLMAAIRRDVGERGTCVLWATHLVDEARQADRVVVLHKGVLKANGTPDQVADELGGGTLEQAFIKATA